MYAFHGREQNDLRSIEKEKIRKSLKDLKLEIEIVLGMLVFIFLVTRLFH